MACFSNVNLAVVHIIAICVCVTSARPHIKTKNVNTTMDNRSIKVPHWVRFAVKYLEQLVMNKNIIGDADTDLKHGTEQDNTFKAADDFLPVLIHKEDEKSGIKMTSFPLLDTGNVNRFVRSKKIRCTTPANLPQMVKDLNKRLTSSQLVGLNPRKSSPPVVPVSQPDTCPTNATGDWWPKPEINLRSTCPWRLQQVDLGVNAFPRYVNTAVCLCNNSCIGSPSMRCMELTYDVTYFNRTGCENGLAVMEIRQRTVNIGCHCVSALERTTIADYTSQR